jgi:hypothetical protein
MAHSTTFQKSPAYAGGKIYNHLAANIKELACDKKSFKKHLKTICMSIPFIFWIKLDSVFDGKINIIVLLFITYFCLLRSQIL